MSDAQNSLVADWRTRGVFDSIDGDEIFVFEAGPPTAPALVLLHGFPGSSLDWHLIVDALSERARVIAPDLRGFGLSSKPPQGPFSMGSQADLVTAVLAKRDITRCAIVAHDMGDTVAAELAHRSESGDLEFAIDRIIVTNGSIYIDMAKLSDGQEFLLALPDEPLEADLNLDVFRSAIRETFSSTHQLSLQQEDAMLQMISHNSGDRLLPRLIRYVSERRANQKHFTDALTNYTGPLTAAWGRLDPIAVVTMTERLRDLRPATEVIVWDDVGHWPALEAPERLGALILERFDDEIPETGLLGAE